MCFFFPPTFSSRFSLLFSSFSSGYFSGSDMHALTTILLCLTDPLIAPFPQVLPFDPFVAAQTDYPITTYQPTYFLATSFEDAKEKMRQFNDATQRPFHVRYRHMTQTLEVDRNIKVPQMDTRMAHEEEHRWTSID